MKWEYRGGRGGGVTGDQTFCIFPRFPRLTSLWSLRLVIKITDKSTYEFKLRNKDTYTRHKEWRLGSFCLLYRCNSLHQLQQRPESQACNCCFEPPHSIYPLVVRHHLGILSLCCRSDHTNLRIFRSWLYRQLGKSCQLWWSHSATFRFQHL